MADFEPLSRQRRGAAGYSRLWLADNHLLLVSSSGFSEEYRRFYFSDIQAIRVRKTNVFAIVNAVFGTLAVFFGGISLAVSDRAGLLFLWTLSAICAVTAIVNASLGPTCSVLIQTPIATHPLDPLRRWRSTRKVLARLVPLIRSAQGELAPEQLAQITSSPQTTTTPPILAS